MIIRKAQPNDAADVIPLIYSAIGDIAYALTGTDNTEQAFEAMEHFFRSRGNRLSYENIMVAELEGQLAGFLLSYHGKDISRLDAPIIQRLQQLGQSADDVIPEAHPDEYYLDSIAVHPSFQGQGIGSRLIACFEQLASQQGYSRLLLIVDVDNDKAKALYERLGYTEDGTIHIRGHAYHRMIRLLSVTSSPNL
ncbi:GNAT family N-acetyltransferase [Paenibacillus wulumuqiensis]|uniref:GNAT family N-acetyltransferase n=1 Tax=Paenibacillus wulumuqiensis TaxID=1567107 RepID=UPI0006967BED|nr:N-acetyltransferase [Paenibacillus wulumuqiensis]